MRALLSLQFSLPLLVQAAFVICASGLTCVAARAASQPNIVVIFTDDQGYGDLGCFDSETIRSPRIDQLAQEGTRFTSFYAQVVCGPSRSALLTGRYPVRSLGWSMPGSEITIAELLQDAGYATGCIGKWDVSNRADIPDRIPTAQGFDYYWGTLGANDNGKVTFYENEKQVGDTDDMSILTRRYTDQGIEFIKRNRDKPFFLYLAHTMVHSVIDASAEFRGKSKGGLYGDTVEEIDFETGRLLDTLDELDLSDNTLVIFTSDNGPWNNLKDVLGKRHNGEIAWGSSGPLREGKGSTYEGGIRVPCIARWPGKIPAAQESNAIFATIDFLPTFAAMASAQVPNDRTIDGVNQLDLLLGHTPDGARDDYYYFCRGELHAVRKGSWKLLLADRKQAYGYVNDKGSQNIELYDLATDVGEKHDLAAENPNVVRRLLTHATDLALPDTPYDSRIRLAQRKKQLRAASVPGSEMPIGDWKQHGLTEAQLEQIRDAFRQGIHGKLIPGGGLMLIHRGEVILKEAFGLADLETKRPFRVQSPCRIASLTKPHTATLIAILVDQGKLALDQPVDDYLPEFKELMSPTGLPQSPAPTLAQCLSHTAGFAGNNSLKSGKFSVTLDGQLSDVVADLATKQLVAEPGTRYAYSRLGYIVAGRVAEVVTGRPYQELLRRYLLDPIGATDATFSPSPKMQRRIPVAYVRSDQGLAVRTGDPLGTVINPGGSLVSTLDNVGRLMLLHRNKGQVGKKQVVSQELLEQMTVSQPATRGDGYGLGFNIMARRDDGSAAKIRHTGASGTLAVLDFERDLITIVLTQVPQKQTNRWRGNLVSVINNSFDAETE